MYKVKSTEFVIPLIASIDSFLKFMRLGYREKKYTYLFVMNM